MNPTHSILDVIKDSKQAVLKLLTMEKYQQHQNTYPMVSEVYNFFEEIPAKTYPSSYDQIPTLPVDLKTKIMTLLLVQQESPLRSLNTKPFTLVRTW